MRITEYIHFLKRDDIGIARNPDPDEYTHLTPSLEDKRERYLYQCMIKGKKPVK